MVRKVLLLTVLVLALGLGAAQAQQIDSMTSTLAAVTLGLPPTVVHVNPGGLGDALIYGYYNVKGKETYFALTNTSQTFGAEVRIRFREAATIVSVGNGSQEILDFDICLSPGDVWSGVIRTDSGGAGRLFSRDTDTFVNATDPRNPVIFAEDFPDGVQFKFGAANPVSGITAEDTREGYFEVIAMRLLVEVPSGGDCGPTLLRTTVDVPNDLMGQAYIVNLEEGQTFGYVATALADFTTAAISPLLTPIGSDQPNFSDNSESTTIVPVNYALTKRTIRTVYDLQTDPDLGGKTQVIVTFPTKLYTHTPGGADDIFDDPRVKPTIYNDQEDSPITTCEFSPCPVGQDAALPHEVNVVDLNGSGIFTSAVTVALSTSFSIGWMEIDLLEKNTSGLPTPVHSTVCINNVAVPATHCPAAAAGNVYVSFGLPAIGYVVHTFGGDPMKFSGMLPLQYTSDIQVVTP